MPKIEIKSISNDYAKVFIDGNEIKNILSIELSMKPGETPVTTLRIACPDGVDVTLHDSALDIIEKQV